MGEWVVNKISDVADERKAHPTIRFRYVELTFPGSPGEPPPSLATLEVAYVRSAVATTGMLSFSNALLQQVHENIRWGQASNLQMVPTDCDNRDERYGWTGDAAITKR